MTIPATYSITTLPVGPDPHAHLDGANLDRSLRRIAAVLACGPAALSAQVLAAVGTVPDEPYWALSVASLACALAAMGRVLHVERTAQRRIDEARAHPAEVPDWRFTPGDVARRADREVA